MVRLEARYEVRNSEPVNQSFFSNEVLSIYNTSVPIIEPKVNEWRRDTVCITPNLEVLATETFLQKVEEICQQLLARNDFPEPSFEFKRKLIKFTYSYKNVMEEFSVQLNKWSELRKRNIQSIQHALQKFAYLKTTTTGITLASSALELFVGFGSLISRLFHFNFSPKYTLLMQAFGGLSITYSFSALLYSNHTVEDIVRDIRSEKYLLRDIEAAYRKGNWIDKDMQDLFPQSIDLNLVDKMVFDANGNLRKLWKQHMCSAIIQSNVKKDRKLFNENFLAEVKTFVEGPAAEILVNRIKLRSLLDELTKKLDSFPVKKNMHGNEVFMNLAAINMYPYFLSLFVTSEKLQETKFIINSLAALSSIMRITNNEDAEFVVMKQTFTELQNGYKCIKKVTKSLVTEYD